MGKHSKIKGKRYKKRLYVPLIPKTERDDRVREEINQELSEGIEKSPETTKELDFSKEYTD